MKNRMNLAQHLQGLSYKVCHPNITKIFRSWIAYSSFQDTPR